MAGQGMVAKLGKRAAARRLAVRIRKHDDFLDGMRGLGYVDGRNFEFVPRYAEGFQDRLLGLTQEIVALKPNVIVGRRRQCRSSGTRCDLGDPHRLPGAG